VSQAPPQAGGLSVPFLVDPEHQDLADHIENRRFFWLDLQGPTNEQLHKVASKFGLHPLTVDDARTFSQRPKIEEYGGYIYLVAYGVDPGTSSGGPLLRELHMIISGRFVVTIHRRPLKALEELRARYDEHPLRGEQFLVYKILDAMTATFFPVVTRIDDDIDEIEQQVIDEPREEILKRIFSIKRDLVAMTIIATISLPLTFLTGFFGQNFTFLTNHLLHTTWSFVVFGLGLLLVSVVFFVFSTFGARNGCRTDAPA
jgi:magnesium transporter